jgi:hypothetical protein
MAEEMMQEMPEEMEGEQEGAEQGGDASAKLGDMVSLIFKGMSDLKGILLSVPNADPATQEHMDKAMEHFQAALQAVGGQGEQLPGTEELEAERQQQAAPQAKAVPKTMKY